MKTQSILNKSLILLVFTLILYSCVNTAKKPSKEVPKTVYSSDVIPFFNHWNLILGDGSNAGIANNFEHEDFFYSENEGERNWVVYKAPNAGDTHGTSNNTRTELAQLKKWSALTDAKLRTL